MHPVGDMVQGLGEIPDGEGLTETFVPSVSLSGAFMSGVLVICGFIRGRVGGKLIF
jgi:hypothetical protein